MSKIEHTREVERTVVVGLVCDICAEETVNNNTDGWETVTASHESWGNDSGDSRVEYDCCSPECFVSVLNKCLIAFSRYAESTEINDWSYQFTKSFVEYIETSKKA